MFNLFIIYIILLQHDNHFKAHEWFIFKIWNNILKNILELLILHFMGKHTSVLMAGTMCSLCFWAYFTNDWFVLYPKQSSSRPLRTMPQFGGHQAVSYPWSCQVFCSGWPWRSIFFTLPTLTFTLRTTYWCSDLIWRAYLDLGWGKHQAQASL